jgi:hypothetical protein
LPNLSASPFASWPIPSLARAKGTWLGALEWAHFFGWFLRFDEDCNVHYYVSEEFQKPMGDLVDAFLYLGPQDLRLREKIPADIALDDDYMRELDRRALLQPFTVPWWSRQQILNFAEDPMMRLTKRPDPEFVKRLVEKCLEYKGAVTTRLNETRQCSQRAMASALNNLRLHVGFGVISDRRARIAASGRLCLDSFPARRT